MRLTNDIKTEINQKTTAEAQINFCRYQNKSLVGFVKRFVVLEDRDVKTFNRTIREFTAQTPLHLNDDTLSFMTNALELLKMNKINHHSHFFCVEEKFFEKIRIASEDLFTQKSPNISKTLQAKFLSLSALFNTYTYIQKTEALNTDLLNPIATMLLKHAIPLAKKNDDACWHIMSSFILLYNWHEIESEPLKEYCYQVAEKTYKGELFNDFQNPIKANILFIASRMMTNENDFLNKALALKAFQYASKAVNYHALPEYHYTKAYSWIFCHIAKVSNEAVTQYKETALKWLRKYFHSSELDKTAKETLELLIKILYKKRIINPLEFTAIIRPF